jgi:Zn-finger nucleic acid-binding protein
MKCPNCNETLVMAERQGVEIDYCLPCRGVWLDKGELDKIPERSAKYNTETKRRQIIMTAAMMTIIKSIQIITRKKKAQLPG